MGEEKDASVDELVRKVLEKLLPSVTEIAKSLIPDKSEKTKGQNAAGSPGSSDNGQKIDDDVSPNGKNGEDSGKDSSGAGDSEPFKEPEMKESSEGVRVWKRQKLEGVVPEKLTDDMDFESWLMMFRCACKVLDLEDIFFDGVVGPKVLPKDVEDRKFIARNTIIQYLDHSYLQSVQSLVDGKEILEEIKVLRDPKTNASAIAAWVNLKHFRYDVERSVSTNISKYERVVARYNSCGESLSSRMKRDIFIYTLPTKAKQKVLNTIRVIEKEKATFEYVKAILHEVEKEREMDKQEKERDRALMAKEHKKSFKGERDQKPHNKRRSTGEFCKRRAESEENCAKKMKTYSTKDRKVDVCYNCNKPGHIASNCKFLNKKKCFKCGKFEDHLASDCPLKREEDARQRALMSQRKKFRRGGVKNNGAAHYAGENSDGSVSYYSSDDKGDSGEYLILDSAATEHFFGNEKALVNTKMLAEPKIIQCANKETIKLDKVGEVNLRFKNGTNFILKEAFAHADFAQNLLSVRRLVEGGNQVIFEEECAKVKDKSSGDTVFSAPFNGKLWKVKVDIVTDNGEAYLSVENTESQNQHVSISKDKSRKRKAQGLSEEEIWKRRKLDQQKEELGMLWHFRLGHTNSNYLKYMATKVENMKKASFTKKVDECDDCLKAKFTRQPCNKTRKRAERPLQIIHSDVACAFPNSFRNCRTMLVTFIDDYSRYASVYTIQKKSDVKDMFKLFVDETKREFGDKYSIGTLRCDNGTEYINEELKEFCKEKGIDLAPCPPYTSQLNGVAERFNRTLQNRIRSLLFNSGFPTSLWEYAAAVGTYTYNRVPNKSINLDSPYLRYLGEEPDLSNIRRFGCLVYTRNTDPDKKKLSAKGVPRFMLDYTSTGYTVLDPKSNTISQVKHAHHVESKVYGDFKNLSGDQTWSFLEETAEGQSWMEEEETSSSGNGVNALEGAVPGAGAPEGVVPSSVVALEGANFNPQEAVQDRDDSDYEVVGVEMFTDDDGEVGGQAFLSSKPDRDPDTVSEALKRPDAGQWRKAIKEEYESIKSKGTYELVDKPKGVNIIDSRWVLRVKRDPAGAKYKARLVARGFKLRKKYEKFETFAPVATLQVVRLILALANRLRLPIIQMDVKSAFLNGDLEEEVYMYIPEGFTEELKFKYTKVLKVVKSLYGLPVSPKRWNKKFHDVMMELGMIQDGAEPCLYIWRENEDFVALTLYVDDMLMTGTKKEMLDKVVKVLKGNFGIKVMGEPKKFLGIQVARSQNSLTIHQEEYVKELVKKFSVGKKKIAPTPMVAQEPQREVTKADVVGYEKLRFRSVVGSLSFVANATRPDIAYAVNQLSRNQENPTLNDWRLAKRVVDYLRGSSNFGITFTGKSWKEGEEVECYVDASFASDKVDRKSMTGYIVKVFGDTIAWKSKKQGGVSSSSTEAEYIALASGSKEAITWGDMLGRITGEQKVPVIHEDNLPAECLAKSRKTGRLKHVDISFHLTKDLVEKGRIIIKRVDSKNQTADFLTKPLGNELFGKCRMECMGVNSEGANH